MHPHPSSPTTLGGSLSGSQRNLTTTNPSGRFVFPTALIACLCAITAQAQSPTETKTQDEVVELSPFIINTDQDQGYLAASTMSGSRLNTPLAQTPASISEFTSEFLADINALNVMDAIEYSVGFAESETTESNGNSGQFNDVNIISRGIPRTGSARGTSRNYFIWYLNGDSYNTERLSLSRGPNSILFGLADPGGVINTATKQARFRTFTTVSAATDSEGSSRFTLDHNHKLTDNLALRLNTVVENRETWREFEYYDQQRIHLASTWRPFSKTTIRVEYERGLIKQNHTRSWSARDLASPYLEAGSPVYAGTGPRPAGVISLGGQWLVYDNVSNSIMNWRNFGQSANAPGFPQIDDESIAPRSVNLTGPYATVDNDFSTYSFYLEQGLLKNLYLELAFNEQSNFRDVRQSINHNSIGLRYDPNAILPTGAPNPNVGRYYVESQAQSSLLSTDVTNLRATLTYDFNTGSDWLGHHRLLAMASSEDTDQDSERFREANITPLTANQNLSAAPNRIYRRTYLDFSGNGARGADQNPWEVATAPQTISHNGSNGTVTPMLVRDRWRPSSSKIESLLAAGQSSFLQNDRLNITYGFRHDEVDLASFVETLDPVTRVATAGEIGNAVSYKGDTTSLGAVFVVTPQIAIYGNVSDNFSPQAALDIRGDQLGNNIADGQDFGVKLTLLDNRLSATLNRYETTSGGRASINSSTFGSTSPINLIWETLEGASGPHALTSGYQDTTDIKAVGYEFEVVANLTKGLSLMLNYGTVDSQTSELNPRFMGYMDEFRSQWNQSASLVTPDGTTIGENIAILDGFYQADRLGEGVETQRVRRDTFNTFLNYRFQNGWLKPWSAGLGARYRGKEVAGYEVDGTKQLGDDYWLWDLRLGYQHKVWDNRATLVLALNVKNLLDESDIIRREIDPDGRVLSYAFQTPRHTTLTATLKF